MSSNTRGLFPVTAYGAIPNDGLPDDDAFNAALIAAQNNGGGLVIVPPGQYRINSTLSIPQGVSLKGSWDGPHEATLDVGSTLLAYSGKGSISGTPFITLQNGSSINGLTIYYPEQLTPNSAVSQYPYTIQGVGQSNIENVTLANSYLGINYPDSHVAHFIRNVNMTALTIGLHVDRCHDIGRIENVHIHPRFANTANTAVTMDAVLTYTRANLNGFWIARADWEFISGCFVYGANHGFHLTEGADFSSDPIGSLPNGYIINSGADACNYSVFATRLHVVGFRITNSQLYGEFWIGPNNTGRLQLENCLLSHLHLTGNTNTQFLFASYGSGSFMLSNCLFQWWTDAAILSNGNASISVSNSEFETDLPAAKMPKGKIGIFNSMVKRGVANLPPGCASDNIITW